jgi:bifunctional pyridoxal-dependent enzyme with beta-cystathionase and maltose regulon repressor activities
VDGPAFGDGGAGSFRLNFATPQPILAEMVERIAAALNSA